MSNEPSGRSNGRSATPRIALLCEAPAWRHAFPQPITRLRRAARTALELAAPSGQAADELSLVLTNDAHQQELNRQWRGRDRPTNVLSFPDGTPLPGGGRLLGDVVLALETCRREAREQGKPLADHAVHLVVHGVLHLLGHDHEREDKAEVMEALEVRLLESLGIADPYAATESSRLAGTAEGRRR